MIVLKSPAEIEVMREANVHVAEILDVLERACQPGVSTYELDRIAADELERRKLKSPFLGYHGYPAVLCTSVNEVVVHGIPSKQVRLKAGDIIGVDFGVVHRGFVGDSARTVAVGQVSVPAAKLIEVTRSALDAGIAAAVVGARVNEIGRAVSDFVAPHGYGIVRDFVGHGIGTKMHEEPQIPNYFSKDATTRLRAGLVIAIEPMVNMGTHEVRVLKDNWTAVTGDGRWAAHFEHSVAVTDNGPVVLSRL